MPLPLSKPRAGYADETAMCLCRQLDSTLLCTDTTGFHQEPDPAQMSDRSSCAPQPGSEEARLKALHDLEILDTPPEPEFDDLIQLAAAICGTPMGAISFVDDDRQWFKAALGMNMTETPREVAFCHHTIQQSDVMMVEDARLDSRFHDSPMVSGEGWRFYAGMPFESPDGYSVGSLCVLDRVPRSLTPDQKNALRILAGQVNARLELRAYRRALEQALQEAQAAKARAEEAERRFETFMDAGPFLAYLKDADGRMLYYNQALAQQFSVSREAFLNKTDGELWPAEMADLFRRHDLETLHTGKLQIHHEQAAAPDGAVTVWRSYKFPFADPAGRPMVGGVSLDVTEELHHQAELKRYQGELEHANQRLRELASVDALTGLANRRVFEEQIRTAFSQARRQAMPLSVLMLDVDHFKMHNDRFGHAHGDNVLRSLAHCLRREIRSGDLLARYGGEEFILLLPATAPAQAAILANRLLEAVQRHVWPLAPVTVSIGLSTLHPSTRDTQHLVGRADEAMYAAKCAGRNRVISYADELRFEKIALQAS